MANVHRTLNGDENVWIEFKDRGYPYKLQREIREANDDLKTLEIIAPYIVKCHLPKAGVNGDAVEYLEAVAAPIDLFEVEEDVVVKLIREFFVFRQERMHNPVAPNS